MTSVSTVTCSKRHDLYLLAKAIGRLWAEEDSKVKDFFIKLACDLKEEHLKLHPNYVYKPRKALDKKRRMSAKKQEKLNAISEILERPVTNVASTATENLDDIFKGIVFDFNLFEDGDNLASSGNTDFIPFGDPELDAGALAGMVNKHNSNAMATDAVQAADVNSINYFGMAPSSQAAFDGAATDISFDADNYFIQQATGIASKAEKICNERIDEYKDMGLMEIIAQDDIWAGHTMVNLDPPELDAERANEYWDQFVNTPEVINDSATFANANSSLLG